MTTTLAHPAAEDLGRFAEGTLDDAGRATIVAHIADCDECRVVVVDAAEFVEPVVVHSDRRRWLAAAAAVVITAGSAFFWYESRDPLTPVRQATAKLPRRPIEPRLSRFSYGTTGTNRGGGKGEIEDAELILDWEVAKVLERRGDSPKLLHARGVVHLISAATAKGTEGIDVASERRSAEAALVAAAMRAPNDASYLNDVAAALIASGDPKKRDLALTYLNKALHIDPRLPEALFNRAIELRDRANAVRDLSRTAKDAIGKKEAREAIAAFELYLRVDPSSKWADEAKKNIEYLQESL